MDYAFPDGFLFGTSTAAYQIEGGWNEDGKGENIWDRLVHTRPELIRDGTNGDVACDSYHKYKEDVALAKRLNLKYYRFSISWARIAPSGETHSLNRKGLEYYDRLVDEVIANDMFPMVTMYHWDLPQRLQDLGGWVNPIMSDYFREYARVLFDRLGDRVKWWITFNEPMETCKGYAYEGYAPYLRLNTAGLYLAAHTQLVAHGKVYRMYEDAFKSEQRGKISISINGTFHIPKDGDSVDDVNTAERANQFEFGWFSHPVYKGDYPPVMREWVDRKCKKEGRPWSTLPTFTADEIEMIKGTADFYALNHYSSRLVTRGIDPNPNSNSDAEFVASADASWPKSAVAPWLIVVPDGFRRLLVWLKNEYGNPPLIVTENGYGDAGQSNDADRIDYIRGYLNAVLRAVHEHGCNVFGYTVWSILDNFEWLDGYGVHFGLVKVDFNDRQRPRVPKASYTYLKEVISRNRLTAAGRTKKKLDGSENST